MSKQILTQARLKELLHYNPDTGIFTRRVKTKRSRVGSEVHGENSGGYYRFKIDGVTHFLHRLAFLYMTGNPPNKQVDHKNRVPSDNSWGNLRLVTHRQNHMNMGMQGNNTSGVCGVYWHKRRENWVARVKVEGKNIYIGSYKDIADAKIAIRKAYIKYGFHPSHGQ